MNKRTPYIDNLRWIIVVLVVIFHVVDIFNSTGAKIHFNAPGIPVIDTFGYFVYPWFMGCLFVISGMSARYALQNRNKKEFAKERVFKLLIPFITYMLIFSVPTTAISFTATNGWADFANVPKPILYVIMMSIGMGHLWFILELFVISMVFLFIVKFDTKDKLWDLGKKTNIWGLLLMYIPLLGGAQVLNFLAVFRNIFFLMLFLLGYFVFSHECIEQMLKKFRIPLIITALILFIIQTVMYWGQNFSKIVNEPIVMLYTWIMILAVIGNAQVYLDFSNQFTQYMNKKSFLIYIFHYLPMICIAYLVTKYFNISDLLNYVLVLVSSVLITFLICEVVPKIPIIRFLFGVKVKNSRATSSPSCAIDC